MNRRTGSVIISALLAVLAPPAADASDPSEPHRWHMPRRGARKLAREAVGPLHAEWNRFGQLVNDGKGKLGDWGIHVDLNFFDQYASRVLEGQNNFGTFSWRIMGDWRLFDLGSASISRRSGKAT